MDEERKEEVEVKEEPAQEQEGLTPNCKNALIAFILTVVGAGFAFAWFAAIVAVGLGIAGLIVNKHVNGEVEKQPFRTFHKITKIAAPIVLIVGAVMFVVALIVTIVGAIAAAAAAA